MQLLASTWQDICRPYSSNNSLVSVCWREITKAYQARGRYYHNLRHLQDLLDQAIDHLDQLQDFEGLSFSIFYHDIVYRSLRKDNEPKSAALARKRMEELGVTTEKIEKSFRQIEATQKHLIPVDSTDPDLPFFLDFDLSILGRPWNHYLRYTQQIRKEYRIYPGWMYRKGRTRILAHFLERDRLFYTEEYFQQYEEQARRNLEREIEMLNG